MYLDHRTNMTKVSFVAYVSGVYTVSVNAGAHPVPAMPCEVIVEPEDAPPRLPVPTSVRQRAKSRSPDGKLSAQQPLRSSLGLAPRRSPSPDGLSSPSSTILRPAYPASASGAMNGKRDDSSQMSPRRFAQQQHDALSPRLDRSTRQRYNRSWSSPRSSRSGSYRRDDDYRY